MIVMVQVCVQGSLPMSACWTVHLIPHVRGHLVHEVLPIRVVIVIVMDEGVFVVSWLLISVQVVLQVALSNTKDHIQTGSEMVFKEYLRLLQHLKVATQSEQTVTASLMLRTNTIASNLIA